MVPLQVLLKWPESHEGREYWYVIRRGPTGAGYTIEGYWDENTGKTILPAFSFPIDQDGIAAEFSGRGREWRREIGP